MVGRELCTPEPMSRGDNYAVVIIYNLVAGDLPGVAAVIHTNVLKKSKTDYWIIIVGLVFAVILSYF